MIQKNTLVHRTIPVRFLMLFGTTLIPLLLLIALNRAVQAQAKLAELNLTFSVNSADDNDDGTCDLTHCSLREAIQEANDAPGADHISFDLPPTATIILGGTAFPAINGRLTIAGSAAAKQLIDGNNSSRIFLLNGSSTFTLTDLILVNGAATNGGAILNEGGRLNVRNSIFISNSAASKGGAILSAVGASLSVQGSLFDGNSANEGGAIAINDNTVLDVADSTFLHNHASTYGSAIHVAQFTEAQVRNSSIFSNTANSGGAILGFGTITVTSSTLSENFGGALFYAGTVNFANTILANPGADCRAIPGFGTINSLGYNIALHSCNLNSVGDLENTDPMLAGLQSEQGKIPTLALLPGSPAIDQGNPATPGSGLPACPTTDQRGMLRPADGLGNGTARCDIGAFEFSNLAVYKTGPASAEAGAPITYTLFVASDYPLTLTNVIITDVLPSGATYVTGGTLLNNVVSWTVPSMGPADIIVKQFVVTTSITIVNSDYGAVVAEGFAASGMVPVRTVIGSDVYLPFITVPDD